MGLFKSDPQRKLDRRLVKAVAAAKPDEVESALDAGADVNTPRGNNFPLFNIAYHARHEDGYRILKLLLARGAQVDQTNGVGCTALHGAACRGNAEAVKILLAAGADTEIIGNGKDALGWAMSGGNSECVAALKKPRPEPRVENPDEVVLIRHIGNRIMEEVFDFAAKERITFIRKDLDGPVEAVTRDGFDSIPDRARLREAFDAYARKGGTARESEIFPDVIVKAKPLQKGM